MEKENQKLKERNESEADIFDEKEQQKKTKIEKILEQVEKENKNFIPDEKLKEKKVQKINVSDKDIPFQISEASGESTTPVLEQTSQSREENLEDSLKNVPIKKTEEKTEPERGYVSFHQPENENKYLSGGEQTESFERREARTFNENIEHKNLLEPAVDNFPTVKREVHLIEEHNPMFGREKIIKYTTSEKGIDGSHPVKGKFPDEHTRKYKLNS